MINHAGITYTSQEICNRIGHCHLGLPPSLSDLPTGFRYTGQFTFISKLPETNAAYTEFPHIGMGTAT
jgi:hypothetical protein